MMPSEVQSLLLKILARGGDTRLGRGQHYFSQAVRVAAPSSDRPTPRQIYGGGLVTHRARFGLYGEHQKPGSYAILVIAKRHRVEAESSATPAKTRSVLVLVYWPCDRVAAIWAIVALGETGSVAVRACFRTSLQGDIQEAYGYEPETIPLPTHHVRQSRSGNLFKELGNNSSQMGSYCSYPVTGPGRPTNPRCPGRPTASARSGAATGNSFERRLYARQSTIGLVRSDPPCLSSDDRRDGGRRRHGGVQHLRAERLARGNGGRAEHRGRRPDHAAH